jgi:adenylate cyclase
MERKLTAIFCADVFGYSRLTGENEEATHRTLRAYRKLIDALIEQHRGRFVHSAGDSVLAEFPSVVNAVQCAVEIQTALKAENAALPAERRMEFRIGINLGDVIADGVEIYGDGVNVAARLESLADPGAIFISGSVREQVGNKLPLGYTDLGEQSVKNIAHPVRVFRVLPEGGAGERSAGRTTQATRKYVRRGAFSIVGLGIIAATIVLVQHVSLKPPRTSASIPPPEKPALSLPNIPSIAVLPFTNLSGDPQEEYFSDGISDQIINDLSRLPALFVIARNSSFTYKGKSVREQEIGKELGVKYLLEGSVHKEANRVRIGVQLVDASSGTDVWTQKFDRPLKDIFAVQDEIVRKVIATLGLVLKLDQMKLPHGLSAGQPTDNLEAFDDSLRAFESFWRLTKEGNAKARLWAEKAIEQDPKFAQAYAILGSCYWSDVLFRWSENPKADLERAAELARKALALDDSNGLALSQLCEIDWMYRQFDRAVADGERCVAINPSYPICYQALSDALATSGRPEEALRAAEQAIRLDPSGKDFYDFFVGAAYVEMGRFQEAIPLLKRHLAAYPDELYGLMNLVVADVEVGRSEEARTEAAEIMRVNPQFAVSSPENGTTKSIEFNRHFNDDMRKAGLK